MKFVYCFLFINNPFKVIGLDYHFPFNMLQKKAVEKKMPSHSEPNLQKSSGSTTAQSPGTIKKSFFRLTLDRERTSQNRIAAVVRKSFFGSKDSDNRANNRPDSDSQLANCNQESSSCQQNKNFREESESLQGQESYKSKKLEIGEPYSLPRKLNDECNPNIADQQSLNLLSDTANSECKDIISTINHQKSSIKPSFPNLIENSGYAKISPINPVNSIESHMNETNNALIDDFALININARKCEDSSSTNSSVHFQFIPINLPGRLALFESIERTLAEGIIVKIGRQIQKNGQLTIKGNKIATDYDIWFTSQVISRLHCEMWVKNGIVFFNLNFSFISKILAALLEPF